MKKASEYRKHAEECRVLAKAISNRQYLATLADMAETWENLARDARCTLARDKRIAALAACTTG